MLAILVILCLAGFLLWLVPMDSRIKTIIIIIIAVVVAVMLYRLLGGGSLRLGL